MEMKNGNGATQNGNSFRPVEPKRDPKVNNQAIVVSLCQVFWQAEFKYFLVLGNTLDLLIKQGEKIAHHLLYYISSEAVQLQYKFTFKKNAKKFAIAKYACMKIGIRRYNATADTRI
jgi:hypothetical protein